MSDDTPEKVEKKSAPEESRADSKFREIGRTGLRHWSGTIDEEWLRALKNEHKYQTLREMRDNDPIIGAILFAVDMLIRRVEWTVEPATDKSEDQEHADFVKECMHDMSQSWASVISEILSFLPYGFSYHEIVYKKRSGGGAKNGRGTRSKYSDGKIGWRKLPIRSQDSLDEWDLDDTGGVRAMIQRPAPSYQTYRIPIEKALHFRSSYYKGNPEGRSILRNAFRPWSFKKRIEEIEGIGIERDLAGLPIIYAPARIMMQNANDIDKSVFTELKNIVGNIRRDEQEGIIMPGDRDQSGNRLYDLELLTTGGVRQFDTNEIINRYDQRIAMTVLADFVLLGHEKTGSFALNSSKTAMFSTAIGAWLGEISSIFNQYAIPRLFEMNGIELEAYPELQYGDIETPDLKELGEYIGKLAGAGMELFPDEALENALRGHADLPDKDLDEIPMEDLPPEGGLPLQPGGEQPPAPAAPGQPPVPGKPAPAPKVPGKPAPKKDIHAPPTE